MFESKHKIRKILNIKDKCIADYRTLTNFRDSVKLLFYAVETYVNFCKEKLSLPYIREDKSS